MNLLLDTCTFLWTLSGDPPLPGHVAEMVRSPDNQVFLSAASAWEISIKYATGRLQLPEHPALHASRLPSLHRDPFDRLLVSQAIVHGLIILAPDPIVARYPARTMW